MYHNIRLLGERHRVRVISFVENDEPAGWELVREVMRPGALDELTKEMIYAAVSITNNCEYCIHSHTASAFNKGMTDAQYQELLGVVSSPRRRRRWSKRNASGGRRRCRRARTRTARSPS